MAAVATHHPEKEIEMTSQPEFDPQTLPAWARQDRFIVEACRRCPEFAEDVRRTMTRAGREFLGRAAYRRCRAYAADAEARS